MAIQVAVYDLVIADKFVQALALLGCSKLHEHIALFGTHVEQAESRSPSCIRGVERCF